MSWSDLFYPHNPEKRDEVVRLGQELRDMLTNNFKATNKLVDCIQKCGGQYSKKIYTDDKKSIKENCDALVAQIKAIEDYLSKKDAEIKTQISTDVYEKMKDINTSFKDKMETLRKGIGGGIEVQGVIVELALIAGIDAGAILVELAEAVGGLVASTIAGVALGVFVLGIDMIASAIIGHIESHRLDESIAQLKDAVQKMRPASDKFDDNVAMMRADLEECKMKI